MKTRQFISILGVVALVAVIYSPSTIGFSASPGGDGGTGPVDASSSGTSMLLSNLRGSGYHVTVANSTQEAMARLSGGQKVVYLLIGPDLAVSNQELQAISSGYKNGTTSVLIAEGNSTNNDLLRTFGAHVTGAHILDPTSTFKDERVFTLQLSLTSATGVTGVIDVASPLTLYANSSLHAAAVSSPSSYDERNATAGPRTVIGTGSSASGARALLITDSGPFTNYLFNYTQQQGAVNETAFVAAMVGWVDPGRAPILLDASHYTGPQPPKFEIGLPVGPLVAYSIEQSLSGLNTYYANFPSQVSGFLGGFGVYVSAGLASALVALILLLSVYAAVTRWFAPERKGKDDEPQPSVERTIVAQSSGRADFLQISRSKGGYVATLAQLYEVLDSIVVGEFGTGISSIEESALAAKIGEDEARRAKKLFLSLSRLHDYASGEMRFLFPPVLRWRALTTRMTGEAEAFLNLLGITAAGEAQEDERSIQRMEYLMRDGVRA